MEEMMRIEDWGKFAELAREMAEQGAIPIWGEFCPELERIVLECIHIVTQSGSEEAKLLINSDGGSDTTYSAIKGAMTVSGLKFTGIVQGYAHSNGLFLLQLCHQRLAVSTATLMIHWGGCELNNAQLAAVIAGEDWPLDDLKAWFEQEIPAICERSGLSRTDYDTLALAERVLPAATALSLGLLDGVLPELPSEIQIPSLT